MNSQWKIMLVAEDNERLHAQTSYRELMGIIRSEERIVLAFMKELAPPGASSLSLMVYRSERGWQATGAGLGRTLPVEVITLDGLYARTPFKRSHIDTLDENTVLLIGLGSLGSSIAMLLARAGVGGFILADPDRLDVANLSRHVGTLLDLGRFKCDLVREQLRQVQPRTAIASYTEDIFAWDEQVLHERIRGLSCLIATTDRRSVQLMANELGFRLGVPGVFAGCYEEGKGGEVFCTLPGADAPCYACLREGLEPPREKRVIDYSTAQNAEDYTGEPGMFAAVNQVACVAAQMALSMLLAREPDSVLGNLVRPDRQFVLVGTGQAEGFYRFRRPFDCYFQRLSGPRSTCVTCSNQVVLEAV